MDSKQAEKKSARRYVPPTLVRAVKLAEVTAGEVSVVTGRTRLPPA